MKLKLPKLFNRQKTKTDDTFNKILKMLRYIGLTLDLMVIEKKLWREFPDQMHERNQKYRKRIFKEEFGKLKKS